MENNNNKKGSFYVKFQEKKNNPQICPHEHLWGERAGGVLMKKCLAAWVEHWIDFYFRTTATQEEISRTDLFANFI